jgi:hypothetical protein
VFPRGRWDCGSEIWRGCAGKSRLLMRVSELSLTVPITNSMAFLFTVIGEWWVERKVISRGKRLSLLRILEDRTDRCRYLDWNDIVIVWDSIMCSQQVWLNRRLFQTHCISCSIFYAINGSRRR